MSRLDNLMQQAIDAKLAKLEEDKLQATGETINENVRVMTPHEFFCVILGRLNADIKVHTVEVRTLCLMIQEQATQLRTIREVTNQGVRSGRVVG